MLRIFAKSTGHILQLFESVINNDIAEITIIWDKAYKQKNENTTNKKYKGFGLFRGPVSERFYDNRR